MVVASSTGDLVTSALEELQRPFLIPFAFTEIEDDDDEDNDRLNGASGDHERNNDSIFAELSRGGKFGLEEVDDGASITGQ